METTCAVRYFGVWDCNQPAIGAIEVWLDNDKVSDYSFCVHHEGEATRKAAMVANFMSNGGEDIFNVRMIRVIEGQGHRVEHAQLPGSLAPKEF